MTIVAEDWSRALPTTYAGCAFRSRLEARWAVFFDVLGITWEYEPQGFEAAGHRWLPDFWLPETNDEGGTWVEVKGSIAELVKCAERYGSLIDFASPIPGVHESDGSTCGVLVLGPIPRPDGARPTHWIYQHHKGVSRRLTGFSDDGRLYVDRRRGAGCGYLTGELPLGHWDTWSVRQPVTVRDLSPERGLLAEPWHGPAWKAYNAARRARFEHGETPTVHVGRATVGPDGLTTP